LHEGRRFGICYYTSVGREEHDRMETKGDDKEGQREIVEARYE
jgi:hypothetical protein